MQTTVRVRFPNESVGIDIPIDKVKEDFTPEGECPFGDGKAAEKILQLL